MIPERIRVARVITRLNVGGPALHVALLTRGLDPQRFTTRLMTGVEGRREGHYLALHDWRLPDVTTIRDLGREISGWRDLRVLGRIVQQFRTFRPDIVHTHTAKAGVVGRLAARICRVPIVVHTFHGHVLRGYFPPLKTRAFAATERWLARSTSALVAVSSRVRDELLDIGVGTPEQFHVVPLGVDLARFRDVDRFRGELRSELGIPPGSPIVGIVARLVAIKAHDVFLHAAGTIAARRPDAQFVVAGDGERREALQALAGQLALSGRVHFLGWRSDLDRLYADLDVVTLTSRNEGSPVALIEAMASGRPVVSTAVGGVQDVVTDGVTGRLVEEGDANGIARAVLDLLADRRASDAMGARARESVASRYSSERLVADVSALYDRLFSERPDARTRREAGA